MAEGSRATAHPLLGACRVQFEGLVLLLLRALRLLLLHVQLLLRNCRASTRSGIATGEAGSLRTGNNLGLSESRLCAR